MYVTSLPQIRAHLSEINAWFTRIELFIARYDKLNAVAIILFIFSKDFCGIYTVFGAFYRYGSCFFSADSRTYQCARLQYAHSHKVPVGAQIRRRRCPQIAFEIRFFVLFYGFSR